MAVTLISLPKMTNTGAVTATADLNQFYIDNEIQTTHVAKTYQSDLWGSTGMPVTREVEFDAASIEVKSKFGVIGALAMIRVSTNPTETYLEAWEIEYTKMFG